MLVHSCLTALEESVEAVVSKEVLKAQNRCDRWQMVVVMSDGSHSMMDRM